MWYKFDNGDENMEIENGMTQDDIIALLGARHPGYKFRMQLTGEQINIQTCWYFLHAQFQKK